MCKKVHLNNILHSLTGQANGKACSEFSFLIKKEKNEKIAYEMKYISTASFKM